jgi:hypothetical protein
MAFRGAKYRKRSLDLGDYPAYIQPVLAKGGMGVHCVVGLQCPGNSQDI